MFRKFIVIIALILSVGCSSYGIEQAKQEDIESITNARAKVLDAEFNSLINKHRINTLGVAVIKNNKLVWQNYYGWQSEGIPASESTLFNVASLTKPVVAEAVLRLVAQGKLALDESVATYWVDPDLMQDDRVQLLTPRMLLNHTSGFMNWRYFSEQRKLSFINPPGSSFGYSGEGFEYLAKYAENKLRVPFEQLVQTQVFDAFEMKHSFLVVDSANSGFRRI